MDHKCKISTRYLPCVLYSSYEATHRRACSRASRPRRRPFRLRSTRSSWHWMRSSGRSADARAPSWTTYTRSDRRTLCGGQLLDLRRRSHRLLDCISSSLSMPATRAATTWRRALGGRWWGQSAVFEICMYVWCRGLDEDVCIYARETERASPSGTCVMVKRDRVRSSRPGRAKV